MNYVGYINQLIRDTLSKTLNVVSFGQNIVTGSCLGGLTRGLPNCNGNLAINTTNSECTLTGVGFGLMLEGVNGIFFVKQQDFMLLGMDHLVHTWNALRTRDLRTSYTIFAIVVDNGFEGPQSCINNLADFCSVAHIPGYTISNKDDADTIIGQQLVAPGVRIIGVSQRQFKTPIGDLDPKGLLLDAANCVFQYGSGEKATIVSMNFAFTEAMRLSDRLRADGLDASLFNVSNLTSSSWEAVFDHAARSKRVVICDDTKSLHKPSVGLAYHIKSRIDGCLVSLRDRKREACWSWPNPDKYVVEPTDMFDDWDRLVQ